MLRIKIIGAETAQQKELVRNVTEALKNIGVEARIITVTDWQDIMNFDIISIPALIIRNQVLSQGFVPNVNDIERLIKAFVPNDNCATAQIPSCCD